MGYQKCKGCHLQAFQSWKESRHARATVSLSKDDQKDGRCLQCHATGFAQPASLGQLFENVQCEACHGPGSAYKSPRIMSKGKYRADPETQRRRAVEAGMTPIEASVCLECHGKPLPQGHAPRRRFDFSEAVRAVSHQGH
jgi:DnaJ-class molecular chaperone